MMRNRESKNKLSVEWMLWKYMMSSFGFPNFVALKSGWILSGTLTLDSIYKSYNDQDN